MKSWVCSQCHINQVWRCMAVISRSRGRRITSLRSTSTRYQGGVQLGFRTSFENQSKQAPYVFLYTSLFFFSCKKWSISIFFQRKEGNSMEDPQESHGESQQPESQEDRATLGSDVWRGATQCRQGSSTEAGNTLLSPKPPSGSGPASVLQGKGCTGSDKEQKPV